MSELKYSKYIVTEPISDEDAEKMGLSVPKQIPGIPSAQRLLWLDADRVEGAFYMEVVHFVAGFKSPNGVKPHFHDYDEVLGFVGTNPETPRELCGEVELWIDDEKHILNKNCFVFIPRGLKHCPLYFRRTDSPILHFSVTNGNLYSRTMV